MKKNTAILALVCCLPLAACSMGQGDLVEKTQDRVEEAKQKAHEKAKEASEKAEKAADDFEDRIPEEE